MQYAARRASASGRVSYPAGPVVRDVGGGPPPGFAPDAPLTVPLVDTVSGQRVRVRPADEREYLESGTYRRPTEGE